MINFEKLKKISSFERAKFNKERK
uniref:Uncharacterized protein n=1 Tax=Tetranychus urticae TaxID=32264 RepID=T1K177_TETUR